MRHVRALLVTAVIGAAFDVAPVRAAEVTLFDSHETTVAYIAGDLTIYLWNGEPVAYLAPNPDGGQHIYAFNGRHLGWYVAGVVRDHGGLVVGARKGAFASGTFAATQYEGFKAIKQPKPFKAFPEFPPMRPALVNRWSQQSLDRLLAASSSP